MNFLKNIQKLVAGEFFEDQVNSQYENYFDVQSQSQSSSSSQSSQSSLFECWKMLTQIFQQNNQSSSNNSNLQPKKYVLNNLQIQEDKLLSEGGYGYVWKAHNVENKDDVFAVKRMICQDKSKLELAKRELQILYKLPQHENIVKFIEGDILREDQITSQAVFLMEYCPDGTLFNLMEQRQKNGGLSEIEIINITLEICKGLQVLHSINMTHRDLKIENVLIKDGKFKLCDFGSASTDIIDLSKLDRKQQSDQEDIYDRYTTLQSRPPEMCDVFCGEVVDQKVDIWMLGCIVYTMCFYVHPFYESSKLAILSASYKFKSNSKYGEKMHDFIRNLLTTSPKFRPNVAEVISILVNWQNLNAIPLNGQARQIKDKEIQFEEDMKIRDQKVKVMIEKNRQERQQEQQRVLQQRQADKFAQQNKQQIINQQKQKQQKPIDLIEEFDQGWGDFQKAEEITQSNQQQFKDEEIDFNSFQPAKQNVKVDQNNFDFSQFS